MVNGVYSGFPLPTSPAGGEEFKFPPRLRGGLGRGESFPDL
jgi:hypothetical protein